MDWNAAIENHREALKRILAALVAMAEMGFGGQSALFPREGAAAPAQAEESRLSATLPRHLHRAVLTLLRPAESATRRLIVALARGLPAPPPQAGPPKARNTKIVPAFRRKGGGLVSARGSSTGVARPLSFPLLDPLRQWNYRRRRPVATSVPRFSIPGITERRAVPAFKPPLPDDPLDAGRLGRRLAALARVLDDLPGQARRFTRWKARRDHALAAGRIHRVTPLRGGRPPGGRLSRYDPDARRRRNVRDVDEILAHAHALACWALEHPDTS